MTNLRRTLVLTLLKTADLAVVALTFAVALCVASGRSYESLLALQVSVRNVLFLLVYLMVWHLLLVSFGLYRSHRLSPISREWRDLMGVVLLALGTLAIGAPILGFEAVTTSFLFDFLVASFLGLATSRRLVRVLARFLRRHGRNLRNVVVVGKGEGALDMASELARHADLGYHIVEVLQTGTDPVHGTNDESWIVDRLTTLLGAHQIDEVCLALPLDDGTPLIRRVVELCEEQGTMVRVVSTFVDLSLARAHVDDVNGRPVITIFSGPPDSILLAVKRLLDVAVSGIATVVLTPVFLLLAIAIKLDSRGPVFFVQDRVGLNGRRFRFYKFRTMVADAESRMADVEHMNEAQGPLFKIRNDPRTTRLGRTLRRFSIDELPQLLNVLKGDMSLVGPRPLPLRDCNLISVRAHKRRFSVKPGIACLWQVNGREPSFDEWIRHDMEYIDHWSLGLDLKILVKTIPTILSGRGAY